MVEERIDPALHTAATSARMHRSAAELCSELQKKCDYDFSEMMATLTLMTSATLCAKFQGEEYNVLAPVISLYCNGLNEVIAEMCASARLKELK